MRSQTANTALWGPYGLQLGRYLGPTWATPLGPARPDFAELDAFLGQHILFTLEQHFNPKF